MVMLNTLVTVSLFAITAYWWTPAKAHEWYPHDCCHGGDCAAVDQVTRIASAGGDETQFVLTSRHGTAILAPDFPLRESKDHRMHVCMRPSLYGGMGVICVFMPSSPY
jgi:hypothetical protein